MSATSVRIEEESAWFFPSLLSQFISSVGQAGQGISIFIDAGINVAKDRKAAAGPRKKCLWDAIKKAASDFFFLGLDFITMGPFAAAVKYLSTEVVTSIAKWFVEPTADVDLVHAGASDVDLLLGHDLDARALRHVVVEDQIVSPQLNGPVTWDAAIDALFLCADEGESVGEWRPGLSFISDPTNDDRELAEVQPVDRVDYQHEQYIEFST